ncbi:sigma-70 family RNA polymerase sigma factor [Lentzea sp. NPDC005914]|uniref:sigma-70 family RNA polymerase sigma factor n=1 Tax=Lentzea sp. NPDC005914 TaxID=3154572 RepID=UPI0033EADCC7
MSEHHTTSPPSTWSGGTGFDDFYLTHFKPLTVFLLMHGATLTEANDVAQDTMIEAHRSWHRIGSPKAWAHSTASRTLARRRFAAVEDLVADPPESAPPLCGTDIEQWEQRHDVLDLLAGLPERQRQVMAWTQAGFSPKEIAEQLGISSEAVRASLMKARQTLSRRLRRDGGDR